MTQPRMPILEASAALGSDDSSVKDDLSYRWTDEGTSLPDGSVEYESLEVVVNGEKSNVLVGDCIFLKNGDDRDTTDAKFYGENDDDCYKAAKNEGGHSDSFVARIERMWEDPLGEEHTSREMCMKFRARWFFKVRQRISF